MSEQQYLILHAGDELDELRDLRTHLRPLSRLGALKILDLADLDDLSDAGLKKFCGDASALILCLSAPVLALDSVLDDQIRSFIRKGKVEVLLHRPCAQGLVPWLKEATTIPKDGRLFAEMTRSERDRELTELVYRLATEPAESEEGHEAQGDESSIQSEAPSGEIVTVEIQVPESLEASEPEIDSGPIVETAALSDLQASMEVSAEVEKEAVLPAEETPKSGANSSILAAGPGRANEAETQKMKTPEDNDDDACRQFDETCEAVLPGDQPLGDEAIEALVELSVYLGAAREEIGDEVGAALVYRHAVGRLIEVLELRTARNHKVSRFSRVTRLALKQALKDVDAGKELIPTLRTQLEKALARAPQQA